MYRRFHDRFGTAGVVIAVIALIAALGGTAIAAAGLNPTQKKEVTKIAKKYAGKAGAPGATGPTGPAGTNGTNGKDGAAGKDGTNGTNGTNGTSVVSSVEPPGGNCPDAGSKFVAGASTTYACNGANGTNGTNGSPWTAGGTLPPGATETGGWSLSTTVAGSPALFGPGSNAAFVSMSFNVPLPAELPSTDTHFITGAVPPECEDPVHPGAPSYANPEADPGHLCVFRAALTGATFDGVIKVEGSYGASTAGAILGFIPVTGNAYGLGSWAVTGFTPPAP